MILNIIGCGRLARTLAYLWHAEQCVDIGDVLTTNIGSAQLAVRFMGAGNPASQIQYMKPADITLIGTSDDQVKVVAKQLAKQAIRAGSVFFHCSGSQSSAILNPLKQRGAKVASIHPVKSFADPELAVTSFAGTYCGVEGDQVALDVLEPLFTKIGGITFPIDADQKVHYHAASVMACNYLVALQEISLQSFEKAGVERSLAMNILQPLVEGTVDNIFTLGTTEALTGPIARSDTNVVKQHIEALQNWRADYASIYRLLGQTSLALAKKKKGADVATLECLLNKN